MWVAWIFIVLAVIAALSAGMALGLHLLKPDWSERRRVLWSGTIAALLPMSVAFGGFFYGAEDVLSGGGEDFVIGLMALLSRFRSMLNRRIVSNSNRLAGKQFSIILLAM